MLLALEGRMNGVALVSLLLAVALAPAARADAFPGQAKESSGTSELIFADGFEDVAVLPTLVFATANSSGGEATPSVSLPVQLSAASMATVSVRYAVVGGDATGGGIDFTLTSGTLTFSPGEILQNISLTVSNDCLVEPDEIVIVQLSAPVQATLGPTSIHTYSMVDDDGIDPGSLVSSSSNDGTPLSLCMVAGSGAKALVWTDLKNTAGAPIVGASVTFGGVAATSSSARPGTYWREIDATGTPGVSTLPVVATTCSGSQMLTSGVTINHLAAIASTGGTGGCSPADGNLRVRVIEDETGAPIRGASVLVGPAQGMPFEHGPDARFGGTKLPASNVALTDASGYARYYDYGPALAGPQTATGGAVDRAYFTVTRADASDLVLALPLLHPPAVSSTTYDNGIASSIPPRSGGCANVQAGIVLPKLSLDLLSSFDPASIVARSRCVNTGIGGNVPLPENMFLPSQSVGPLCLGAISAAPWSIALRNTAATADTETVEMFFGQAPVADLQSGGFMGLLRSLTYSEIGFIANETVPTLPTSGRSITLDSTYPSTFTVSLAGNPPETDVIGVTAVDYSGRNGIGSLGVLAVAIKGYTDGGSTVPIRNSALAGASAPPGVRRLATITARYLDPGLHPAIAINRRQGATTVLLRDDGAGGAPFGGAANANGAANDFLDLAGTTFTAPGEFAWEDASANGNVPLYSVHELTIRQRQHLPVLACSNTNEIRVTYSSQWIVARPFAPICAAGQECFALPTLPAGFPRSASGVQQKSGFEQRLGSGAGCTSSATCLAGETCVDPDAAGPANLMCMRGSGAPGDPHATEDYIWRLHLYDLELAPSFDFNAFEFSQRREGITHESVNTQAFD